MKMRLVVILLVGLSAAGCGGDSSSPSAPPPPTTVSGEWEATSTITGAQPAGHCVAGIFNSQAGNPVSGRVTLNQRGSNVTGSIVSDANTCDYRGTLTGRRLSLQATSCQTEVIDVQCANGALLRVTTLGSSIEGTFDQPLRSFDGTGRTVVNARNNVDSTDITVLASVEMRR